ncbi:MAG TPA: Gfo/Idh/MocA family oxidoreductase [Pyrinomonadaceae bacterium]|jgi:predicted dehydrogenase
MASLRLGIISTANINQRAVIQVLPHLKGVELFGVASRSKAKARAYRHKYKTPKAYETYEELLSAPELDAVYISAPNALHAELTIRALMQGKHVLCEKPLCSDPAQALVIEELARKRNLYVAEAMHYRHHPSLREAVAEIRAGIIGEIKNIDVSFVWDLQNPRDIRLDPALGGGALMDVGCYCLDFIRWLTRDDEPTLLEASAEYSESGVDTSITAELLCSDTISAKFHCDLHAEAFDCRAAISGTRGSVLLRYPFLPVTSDSQSAEILFSYEVNGEKRNVDIPEKTSYLYQLKNFRDRIQNGLPAIEPARTDFYYNAVILGKIKDKIRKNTAASKQASEVIKEKP